MNIVLLSGVPGSGKSIYARANATSSDLILSRDDLRTNLRHTLNTTDYFPVSNKIEFELWIKFLGANIRSAAQDDSTIYIDQTTPGTTAAIKLIRALNAELNAEPPINIVQFHTPLDTCLQRNSKRSGIEKVPQEVIIDMYKRYLISYPKLTAKVPNAVTITRVGGDYVE